MDVRRRDHRTHPVELDIEPTDSQTLFHQHIFGPAALTVPPYFERVPANGWKQRGGK
jgi:hypothetical protein